MHFSTIDPYAEHSALRPFIRRPLTFTDLGILCSPPFYSKSYPYSPTRVPGRRAGPFPVYRSTPSHDFSSRRVLPVD